MLHFASQVFKPTGAYIFYEVVKFKIKHISSEQICKSTKVKNETIICKFLCR